MKTPLIFDIKRSSLEDGPGLRTTIFFKGCNLDCFWCHNPEGKAFCAQTAFFAAKCVGCGECKQASDEFCKVEVCKEGARKLYGKEYSVDELVKIVVKDKSYYDATGGGLTVSGGECMLFADFLASLARACKENGISVFVDTAGNVDYCEFEKVLPYVDGFLYDIKCLDSDLHEKGTGAANERILQNFKRLMSTGKKIIVRIPKIPGFNDGDEYLKVIEFCKDCKVEYEVLDYHEFGLDKKRALNAKKS